MTTGTVQRAAEAKAAERDVAQTRALTLRDAVRSAAPGFEMALPKHIKVDRFIRAAFTAINTVPKLGECTQQSVLAGLMQAAQLGLEVSDVRGQCYLIPRKDNRAGGVMKASFQLGFRGMIDLAARSGITVDAEELHANDDFDFELGTNRYLRHRPTLGDRGAVLAYYATATFPDKRTPAFTIMSVNEISEHRDKFASSRDFNTKEITGPWVDHFDAMARKTVIRALLNYLPVTVELRDAIHADAVEAESTEVSTVDYSAQFQVPELPNGVDAATGEVADPMTVTETTGAESPDQEPPERYDEPPATEPEEPAPAEPAPSGDPDAGELPLDDGKTKKGRG